MQKLLLVLSIICFSCGSGNVSELYYSDSVISKRIHAIKSYLNHDTDIQWTMIRHYGEFDNIKVVDSTQFIWIWDKAYYTLYPDSVDNAHQASLMLRNERIINSETVRKNNYVKQKINYKSERKNEAIYTFEIDYYKHDIWMVRITPIQIRPHLYRQLIFTCQFNNNSEIIKSNTFKIIE